MMGGDKVPELWQGGLDLDYRLGPTFLPQFENYTVRIDTHNYEEMVTSYNVFASIIGSVEPGKLLYLP